MNYFLLLALMLIALPLNAEPVPPVKGATSQPDAAFIPAPADAPLASQSPAPANKQPAPNLFGGKAGDDAIDITADKSLEWHEQERVYIASGHAKAKKGDVMIEADVLKAYDRKKPDGSSEVWRLTAEGGVKVTGKTQTAIGQTAEYDIDTRKAILRGDNLKFQTATDTVTARDSLEYWEIENRAIAKGDALAVREGRQVHANELISQFKKNAKGELEADTMTANGNVHITSAKDVVICDQAIYYVTPNTATLNGNVFITQGSNQLKGDKVEANFKTGTSKIMNTGKGRVHALIRSAKGKPVQPSDKP
ncbi:MAG: LptA/OstA family protein [Alphaproteobacteria bacterium]|nr:LptA/OstA family protein [Alphaproteobacteria bacterium]